MTLFTMNQIQAELDRQFAPLEPMLTGFRLILGGASEEAVSACEKQLDVDFPGEFRSAVKAMNFGRFTIGPIVFCNSGDYMCELVQLNVDTRWWGRGARPRNLFVIANSDPYAIQIDADTGSLLAFDAELGWACAAKIADGFDLFLRGIGTIMLRRSEAIDTTELAREVASDVGGLTPTYWVQLAK